MEDNYYPNIPKWGYANYPTTSMYNDAQMNVLKEGLPFQMDHKSKGIRRERMNP